MLSLDQLTISFVFNGAFFMVSARNWLQGGHKKASTNLALLHLNMQKLSKKLGDFFMNTRWAQYYLRNLCNFRFQLNGHENYI